MTMLTIPCAHNIMYPTVGAFAQYKKMVTGSCFEQKLSENYASKAEFNLQNLTQPSDN